MSIWTQPPGGFTPEQRRQRRRRRIQAQVALLGVVVSCLAGASGYRWVTAVHAVDRSAAIELFRAERGAVLADLGAGRRRPRGVPKQPQPRSQEKPDKTDPRVQTHQPVAAPSSTSPGTNQTKKKEISPRPGTQRDGQEVGSPEQGVYSWATQGHEQVGGARREFPAETQRIITRHRAHSWTQHHYFSEDREIWTMFQAARAGVEATKQRNKVTFGPVTRETTIDFRPPMLAAPRSLRVGLEWEGEWRGDTYGNYSGKVFERTTMTIGRDRVEAWGMTFEIHLHGEQEGRVHAQVWFAPGPHLTVKEHYVQDVDSGGARYHAEWMQTLKSLHPRH